MQVASLGGKRGAPGMRRDMKLTSSPLRQGGSPTTRSLRWRPAAEDGTSCTGADWGEGAAQPQGAAAWGPATARPWGPKRGDRAETGPGPSRPAAGGDDARTARGAPAAACRRAQGGCSKAGCAGARAPSRGGCGGGDCARTERGAGRIAQSPGDCFADLGWPRGPPAPRAKQAALLCRAVRVWSSETS